MIHLKPFRAYRPSRDKAYLVATRSYLSYDDRELDDKLNNNPYTFLHIINPRAGRRLNHGPQKYQLVQEAFREACAERVFIRDREEQYYLYRQEKDGNEYVGLIAAVHVDDYLEGKIKKHEKTLTRREEIFTDYLEHTGFNAEPVLLTYQDDMVLNQIYARYMKDRAEYEFTSTDRVLHQLWLIDNPEDHSSIEEAFSRQENLYIADGHHRCASSALLAQRLDHRAHPPRGEAHRHFMALLIGQEQMKVYDYNRLVANTTGKSPEAIIEALQENFLVESRGARPCKPEKIHELGMYLGETWYKLVPKTGTFDPGDPVHHLDAEILSRNVLAPIFDIHDLKADERIAFLPGTEGLEGLVREVHRGEFQIGFALHPVTVEQIKHVSDAGLTMPPKSTYVEPKLRSGLTVYPILEDF